MTETLLLIRRCFLWVSARYRNISRKSWIISDMRSLYLILPVRRKNGQICILPFGISFIVAYRLCQFHQMTNTPADNIAISYEKTIFTFICTKHLCNALGNRWFLRQHQFHLHLLLSQKISSHTQERA